MVSATTCLAQHVHHNKQKQKFIMGNKDELSGKML